MSGVQPVALYAIQVPPGGIMVPALPPNAAAMVRSTFLWIRLCIHNSYSLGFRLVPREHGRH